MKDLAPFLLAEQGPALEPAQENRLRLQTVAVAGRLEQLDLSNHLKLLQGTKLQFKKEKKKKGVNNTRSCQLIVRWIHPRVEATLTLRLFSKLMRPPCGGTQREGCQGLGITYQQLLRQTALGGPLRKQADKNSTRSYGNFRCSSWQHLHRQTLRSAPGV